MDCAESETPGEVLRQQRGRKTSVSSVSPETVEGLFRTCEVRLGRFLAQMVSDRVLAEDLLQESFYEAFRCRDQRVENPEAWLFGIARNRALAALRRRRRFGRALERLVQRPEPSEDDDLELLALRDLLQRTLDADDRALLILRYMHGFEATELAAMTGRSPEAVRQRLSRARARLIQAAGRESTPWEEERRP
ncbi:MAG TPA: sigma-70 family RNA polymerase sigma factor [Gaiellaceae bacterium]|nr:sigma-70 family RNA polymerase sigma factor [Gaiellaceae bacterium]